MRLAIVCIASSLLLAAESQGQGMPGTPVGTSFQPVGTQLPKVGTSLPKVGMAPPGFDQSKKLQDPFGLQGYGVKPGQLAFDPKSVITPYPQGPAMPEKSYWDKLYDRWAAWFTPESQPQKNYTPGIYRRNRERAKDRFRPD